jgi:superfamily II DNA/RNA helicase
VQKYNTLSQLAAGCCAGFEHTAKANEIVDLLNGELAEQPVVVWTRYLAENRGLVNELVKHRSVWSITGETEQFKRESNVQDWSRCPNGVLVAQQAVFKYGLDLSHASAAVYASVSDDTEEVVQSMDRIVNIRRKHEPLLYVFVVARDTLEDRRIDLLEDRTMTAAKTMAALRNGLRSSLREQLGVSNG